MRSYPKIFKSLSPPNALVGNPNKAMTRPPTKAFGGDSFGISSNCKSNNFNRLLILVAVVLIGCLFFAGSAVAQIRNEADAKNKPKMNQPKPAQKTPQNPPSGAAKTSVSASPNPANVKRVAQFNSLGLRPQPIEPSVPLEPLEKRLAKKINLDVRDMNIMDVIRFLAKNGEFNVVTSSAIEGRATLQLKSVSIKDALDIAVISNHLGYYIQNDIIQVMTAAEYAAMYGKEFSDKTEVAIVHLHYAKPSYVLATLNDLKSAIGKIIIDEDTGSVVMIDTAQTIARMQDAIKNMEETLGVYVFHLQYAKADVVAEKLKARIDANAVGSITADARSNQLAIRALPGRLKEIESVIKSLDAPTKEVLVEARILQIVFKPNYDVGIDWNLDFKDSPYKIFQSLNFNNTYLNDSKLPSSDNLASTFGKIVVGPGSFKHFVSTLRALAKVSDTKILSNPKLLVTNNEEAQIHIGDTVPYIISTTSGTGDNAITSEDVRTVDVGLKLIVTPTINDDGFVTMRLKPEISTVVGKIQSKGGGIPQVNKTELQTTVMIRDGMSIVMGGLKKEDKVHNKTGFPYLMDIPFLGKLFSRTSDTIENTEIVIFITPHIVSKDDDYVSMKGTIKPFKDYSEPK